MATRTSTKSGDWSAAGTWDTGVPADGDDVVIASGHEVVFDVDQSAFTTGVKVTITGTLTHTTAAGSYCLYIKTGASVVGAGTWNVGTSATPIPFNSKHLITGAAGWYVDGNDGLALNVYGAEPEYKYIKLSDAVDEIADGVWDEAIAGHATAGTFGAKNQKVVPSETLNDYKADVSSLATSLQVTGVENKIDTVDSVVDDIKAKTDNLPADPASQSAVESAIDEIPAGISADDILNSIIEGAVTLRDSLKLANAMNAGKVSGGKTTSIVFRDLADTLDRIIMTVDENGNRSAVVKDLG